MFAAKFSGIRYDDPAPVTGARLVLAGAHTDAAGLSQVLDDALAHLAGDGPLGLPNDAKAVEQSAEGIALPAAKELSRLGPVTMTIYLGEEPAYTSTTSSSRAATASARCIAAATACSTRSSARDWRA